jgi:hypothetical protein
MADNLFHSDSESSSSSDDENQPDQQEQAPGIDLFPACKQYILTLRKTLRENI